MHKINNKVKSELIVLCVGQYLTYLDPGFQLSLVLNLLLLHQLLVLVLLALAELVPAFSDLHHAFLQAEVVELSVGQQLLREHLVATPTGEEHK